MSAPTIRFTSDLHLFHDRVATLRGFASVAEWHRSLVERWCAQVKPQDQTWVLGDPPPGGGHLNEALELIASLPGEKHLILGNHDAAHPMHRSSHRMVRRYFPVFTSVQVHARRRIAGRSEVHPEPWRVSL